MSIPDMIYSFVGKIIRFNPTATDLLGIEGQIDKYTALGRAGASWTLDVKNISRFLEDYGYKIIGVL